MTPGEKRSLTSSIKKAYENFSSEKQNIKNENELLSSFYDFWLDNSIKNKLSWCHDKNSGTKGYHLEENFKSEVISKIQETLSEEISKFTYIKEEKNEFKKLPSLQVVAKKIKNIKSKKKRIRNKYKKKLLAI